MRQWRWLASVGVVVAACSQTGATREATTSPPESVSVIGVIDGDSLTVETGTGRLEVRLAGINTPEAGECHHQAARGHLTDLLEDTDLTLEVEGVDRFGRALSRLEADGLDVTFELVRAGHGVAVPSAVGGDRLIEAEDAAHRDSIGMWGPECRPIPHPPVSFDPETSSTDPPGDDADHLHSEIISLINLGDQPVDLAGWRLRDGSSRHRFLFATGGSVIAPGERIYVASSSPGWVPGGEPVWSNRGDIAILLDGSGLVVARWRYRAAGGT